MHVLASLSLALAVTASSQPLPLGLRATTTAEGLVPPDAPPPGPPPSPPSNQVAPTPPPSSPPPSAPPPDVAPPSSPPPSAPPTDVAPPPGTTAPAPPPELAPPPSTTPPAATPPSATPPAATPTEVAPPPSAAPPPSPALEPPPAEVAPPPGEPAPAIATEPEASEEVEPMPAAVPPPSLPPPRQTLGADAPPPPHRNGRGMLVAAAVLGTIGGVIKIGTTVAVAKANRTPDGLPLATLMGGAYFYDPFIGVALGLAGGGMARRGKVDAHRELFEGEPATRKRRMGLGWALFGGGVAMWSLTRLAGAGACREQACTTRIWETGYYLSLLGTVPGVIMGGYATGFNRYHKRYGHLADVTVAPIAHRNAWGLSLSGRF